MIKSVRIMLVEDNPEYREAVRLALEQSQGVELSRQFGTAEIALRSIRNATPSEQPDLILLDLRLPGMSGLEALAGFRESAPHTKVIILTQSDNEEDVLRAIALGASGYLLKSATLDEIADGIRTVMSGGAPLDKGVAKFILESLQTRLPADEDQVPLSQRELEIIQLLAEGLVKKEIARQLGIGYSTVDTHVAHIYEKLNVSNAPSAVNQAHRLGLFHASKQRSGQ
ncbi:Transcriptional regulatory protein LiaR [Stieleria maiorica]|uniref:Transcriptional regulatory protein LiaR n=1 Tax=Stieleria maiorica TaxID=2795974 RepID=A0A5B9MG32_9BACT|nr:response regulator transcription factor [Stieleria maiorica]QEF98544.1 Transcriptional regulatory protein LiaR [Stieleria maiorica]